MEVFMFRKDLTKKGYIVRAIIMTIFYILGILIIWSTYDNNFLLMIVGFLFCGLPFAISFYKKGKRAEDNEEVAVYQVNDDGSYYRVGGWKKFVLSLIGLVLGVVLTPINVIYYIYRAIKAGTGASYEEKVAMAKELSALTGLSYNDCSMALMYSVKKSNYQAFKAGYPYSLSNIKMKCIGLTNYEILRLALIDEGARNAYLNQYPNVIKSIKSHYPYVTDYDIIRAYEKGGSHSFLEKQNKKGKKYAKKNK